MRPLILALLTGALLTQAFIDLEIAVDLGPWHANAPLVDLFGLALLGAVAMVGWRAPIAPPGWRGYALFLLASAISVQAAIDPGAALHHLLRKPIFLYLTYGLALAWAVARAADEATLRRAVLGFALGTAGLSLATSGLRIVAGDALWFQPIAGITPNHKTLSVALAGWVPLVLVWRDRWAGRAALLALALAILASASKTAWITLGFGLAWVWPAGRPLASRPRLIAPILAGALALALYAPILLSSKAMLDAARSRHSLNVRAWEMFLAHPIFGSGTGMNVVHEQVIFPHYRVNGVDAHGVIQKIASETGLVGLAGFVAFALGVGAALRRRAQETGEALDHAAWGTFLALHLNLLLSTETLSPTHWVPLGLCWGLCCRPRAGAGVS